MNHLSIPVTVGLFDNQLLLDPSLAEEEVLHGLVTCSFALPSGALNYLHQVCSSSLCFVCGLVVSEWTHFGRTLFYKHVYFILFA